MPYRHREDRGITTSGFPVPARGPREWVRSYNPMIDNGSVRWNGPRDGYLQDYVSDQAFAWMGLDGPETGQPVGPDWVDYGLTRPPYNGGPVGRYEEWGGQAAVPDRYLSADGILPAITRCTSVIVGPVIRTSWRYFKNNPGMSLDVRRGEELERRPLWTIDPQLTGRLPGGGADRPLMSAVRRLGPHDWWRTLLTHAIWFGRGTAMWVLDANDEPLAGTLRIVHPQMIAMDSENRWVLDPDGELPLTSDTNGDFAVGGVRWRVRSLRGLPPHDDVTPEGVLMRSGLLLRTGTKLNRYLDSATQSGVPSGVLKVSTPNYGETEANDLKRTWMRAHGGSKRSVAVLNSGVDFSPLQLSPVDADVVAGKKVLLTDIAHAFGLSSAWLDSGADSLTYANVSDRRRDLLDHTLADWGRSVEDFVTAQLPYGHSMKIDWTGYLNIDPKNDLEFVRQGLEMGYLTKAEARERLGMDMEPLTMGGKAMDVFGGSEGTEDEATA